MIDYLVPLLRFVGRQKELGLDIQFAFHAGETLSAEDDNLYDATLLGTKANRSQVRIPSSPFFPARVLDLVCGGGKGSR
jgi:hypothetical protein